MDIDMQLFKDQVAKALAESIEALAGNAVLTAEDVSNMLEYPPDPAMGDLALPCFRLSKTLRRSPVQIANQLAEQVSCPCVARIQAVNGYLNFYLSDDVLCDTIVGEILSKGEKYGAPTIGEGKEVVLDYSSPNLAKPSTSDILVPPLSAILCASFMSLPAIIAPASTMSVTGVLSSVS